MSIISLNTFGILTGVITGIIGSLTGIISLIWLIKSSRPKLKLVGTYFFKEGISNEGLKNYQNIGVKIYLKNLSNRATTLESIYLTLGKHSENLIGPQEINMPPNYSRTLVYFIKIEEKEYKTYVECKEKIKFGIIISHTFGVIRKNQESSFITGHFHLM